MVGYGWGKGSQATYVAKGPGVPRIGRQEADDDDEVPVVGTMAVGPYECVYGWCGVVCEMVCDAAKGSELLLGWLYVPTPPICPT